MKLSNTSQRRVIIEELRKLDTHPTADELYLIVRKSLPQISLGTVYRNLELLSEAGEILKIELTGKQKRFDGKVEKHFHLRCGSCGNIEDIALKEMNTIDKKLHKLVEKMKFDGFRLELSGLCSSCRADKTKTKPKKRREIK